MLIIPTLTIHPNNLTMYSEYYSDDGTRSSRGNSMIHQKKVHNISKLSHQSKKKLSKAITYMAHVSPNKEAYNKRFNSTFKFRLSFITLTLSSRQQHDDTVIKSEIFHPFLDYITKVYKVSMYVWKAERQGNKNIHFHLVVDKYIPYQIVKEKWNRYQDKLGYIKAYYDTTKSTIPPPGNKRDYFDINSTDIHSTRKVKDLAKYMCKYMLKDNHSTRQRISMPDRRTFYTHEFDIKSVSYGANKYLKGLTGVGRLWGCSYNLSNLKGGSDTINNHLMDEIELLENQPNVYSHNEPYFKYISFNYTQLKALNCTYLLQLIDEYCSSHFKDSPS